MHAAERRRDTLSHSRNFCRFMPRVRHIFVRNLKMIVYTQNDKRVKSKQTVLAGSQYGYATNCIAVLALTTWCFLREWSHNFMEVMVIVLALYFPV